GRAGVPVGGAVRTAARARGWPCGARLPLDTVRGAGDEGEELVAVRGQLRRADARAGRQLPLGPRPALGDAPQVAVVEHDVDGHAVGPAALAPPGPQGGLDGGDLRARGRRHLRPLAPAPGGRRLVTPAVAGRSGRGTGQLLGRGLAVELVE